MLKYIVGLTLSLFMTLAFSAPIRYDVKIYIPPNFFKIKDVVLKEQHRLMPNFPYEGYFFALSEHESCITLTSKRCLDPTARLLTSKEEGAGIPQLTRTFRKDGTVKMDVLTDMARRYNRELKELSWKNVYKRPDLQIRAMVILYKENYDSFMFIPNKLERVKFSDSAYNGGRGWLNKERIACGVSKNCNPQIYSYNVERYCLRSKKALYGTRSPCDINRHHVTDVIDVRMPKYQSFLMN